MQIDRTNYQVYFLDYIEGNLSVDIINDFLEFLNQNPDLKEELESVTKDFVKLPAETIIFEGKKDLLRDEVTGCSGMEYRSIACLEGDMDEDEENLFKQELQGDPDKQKTHDLIAVLRLRPDSHITFPDKTALLRKEKKYALWIWPGLAAALLVLGFLIPAVFLPRNRETVFRQPVQVDTSKTAPAGNVTPLKTEKKEPVSSAPEATVVASPDPEIQQKPRTKEERAEAREKETENLVLLRPIGIRDLSCTRVITTRLTLRESSPRKEAEYTRLSDFLAQKLLDVPKGEPVTLASIARAGLEAAEGISQHKLNIEKNREGRIKEINFNSLLFGFSIPVKKNK